MSTTVYMELKLNNDKQRKCINVFIFHLRVFTSKLVPAFFKLPVSLLNLCFLSVARAKYN